MVIEKLVAKTDQLQGFMTAMQIARHLHNIQKITASIFIEFIREI